MKDKLGRTKTIGVDPVISEKLDIADYNDKKEEEEIEAFLKKSGKTSGFSKVMKYNHPKILIIPALLAVAANGAT